MKKNKLFKRVTALFLVLLTVFTYVPLTAVNSQAYKEYPTMDYTCEQPLFEFNTPTRIFGDYDDSFAFAATLGAYLTGSHLTADGLWKKVYRDVLYKTLNTNKAWNQFDENLDDAQEIENWIAGLALSMVELAGVKNPIFKLGSYANIATNTFVNVAQNTISACFLELEPVLYLAENASDKNIRAAAQDLIDIQINDALSSFVNESAQELLDKGIDIAVTELKNITIEAIKKNGTDLLTYLPRLLAWVNIIIIVKDIAFFVTGQGDGLDGYINLVADFYIRQELYSYHTYLRNRDDKIGLANNFNNILFVTKDMYNNFRVMMDSYGYFDRIIESDNARFTSDTLLKEEYDLLNTITVTNYYKRLFDIMIPEWNGECLFIYPEEGKHQLVIPGMRYGVNATYDCKVDNKCFTINKKTGLITLSGKDGKGTIAVEVKQNGTIHKINVPVVVTSVRPCTNLKNIESTTNSVKLKWNVSDNAQYYAVYQYVNNSWKLITKDIAGDEALINGLATAKDYKFAVLAYAVVNNKVYKSKDFPVIDTATAPESPTNFRKQTVTDSSITVAWNAAKGASGYRIYSQNAATGKWNVALDSTKSLSATFKNLPQNKSYTLAVRAYYSSGKTVVWSESYPILNVKTAGIPDAPTNLRSTVDDNSVTLTWDKANNASGYQVYRYDAASKKWIKLTTLNKTSFTVTGLSPQTVYRFAVTSYNNEGTKVFYSKTYPTIDVITGLGTVTGFASAARSETAIKLTWNKVKNASGYRVFRYNDATGKWDIAATTSGTEAIVSGLTAGTIYKFAIQAYFKSGSGVTWSTEYPILEATTLPGQVKNFKGTLNGTTVSFTWSAVSGADGYAIYSYNTSTKKYTLEKIVSGTSATIGNLSSNKAYHYVAVAYKSCNGTHRGKQSSFVSLLTLPTDKDVAYMFNKAYEVASVWLAGGTNKIVNFSSSYYESGYYRYYKVEHSTINTKAKLKNHLYNYFSSSTISSNSFNFDTFYKDINGKLYAAPLNAGAGPGTINLNKTKAEFYKYQNGYPVYKISYYSDSYYNGYETKYLILKPQNNKWVFDNYFSVKPYNDCIWDGHSPL